jgi:WD40 repeat protein
VDAGREIRRFEGHRGAVRAVAPAPDGKTLATGGQDRTIRLWDRETARELRQLQGHPGDGAVAFAPNGDQLLSWGGDKGLRLWDVAAAKVVRTFQGHAAAVYNAGFLADGRIYSYSAGDRTLRLWDAATGAETLRVAVGGDATDRNVAVSPDGRYFLSSHTDRTVRWRSAPSGQELGRFTVAADKAVGLSLAPDARHAVGGSFRGFIYLWRLPEAPAVAVRKTWRFDNGFYENTRGNEWFTRAAGATYAYKEVARNDEFIELYDDTRKVGIRIYKDHLDIKNPGKAKWEFLHKGKWD